MLFKHLLMYFYLKALHLIFIVTWFSGLFYVVRLFIYNTEANARPEPERRVLQSQFGVMIRRLWLGITWPSAVITLGFGMWLLIEIGFPQWIWVKLIFVAGLYLYHFSLHVLYRQQMRGIFKFSSTQLRIWNEVATIFLVAVVMIAVVKSSMSWLWGLLALFLLMFGLFAAIRIYKAFRND